ncbi:receptor-type adenylate cyclase GRESAG 4.3 [Striga asiatica]|uniref:Receptor-type adenylate cyclase GRESAG 4.3 n=1 Tax=Striga asiatica TaxID=4170 RepID=A0A5A7QL56_STRAF|nr:receptor-type adenylate cyclase GRESAG 4.3 [Striga asiatica]
MVDVFQGGLVRVEKEKVPPFFESDDAVVVLVDVLDEAGELAVVNFDPWARYTSLNKSIPQFLRRNGPIVLHIDCLENPVQFQFLVIHILSKLLIIDPPILIRVAHLQKLLGEPVIRRDLHCRQPLLDQGGIQVPSVVGIKEDEQTSDSRVPLLLRLPQGGQHVVHRHRAEILHRAVSSGSGLRIVRPRRHCCSSSRSSLCREIGMPLHSRRHR